MIASTRKDEALERLPHRHRLTDKLRDMVGLAAHAGPFSSVQL